MAGALHHPAHSTKVFVCLQYSDCLPVCCLLVCWQTNVIENQLGCCHALPCLATALCLVSTASPACYPPQASHSALFHPLPLQVSVPTGLTLCWPCGTAHFYVLGKSLWLFCGCMCGGMEGWNPCNGSCQIVLFFEATLPAVCMDWRVLASQPATAMWDGQPLQALPASELLHQQSTLLAPGVTALLQSRTAPWMHVPSRQTCNCAKYTCINDNAGARHQLATTASSRKACQQTKLAATTALLVLEV